jgi:hypothetical protein
MGAGIGPSHDREPFGGRESRQGERLPPVALDVTEPAQTEAPTGHATPLEAFRPSVGTFRVRSGRESRSL